MIQTSGDSDTYTSYSGMLIPLPVLTYESRRLLPVPYNNYRTDYFPELVMAVYVLQAATRLSNLQITVVSTPPSTRMARHMYTTLD